ncbi:MAG: GTPase HflX [Alphaproteobacteria bacterium]
MTDRRQPAQLLTRQPEGKAILGRTIIVHPVPPAERAADGATERDAERRLAEAIGLARAINLLVVEAPLLQRPAPRAATLFGTGKVEELKALALAAEAELVYVDGALTPIQQRNLEKAWNVKVIDRTGLILEIFGARARTHEGRLQVELARLRYERSRLVRTWTHLERQRGGLGKTGGPGETQLESDRRIIREKIARLEKKLEAVRRGRSLQRSGRKKVPVAVVALVGYTNAGKSTLFNALTQADVFAENLLFATLDPTMRGLELPSGRRIILSDTVGFISDLPMDLVAAFRATLEEVEEADLILHVRDAASPARDAEREDVARVLAELGIPPDDPRIVEVYSKIDLLDPDDKGLLVRRAGADGPAAPVPVSSITGEGLESLLRVLDDRLSFERERFFVRLAPGDGAASAWLYAHGEVISSRAGEDGAQELDVVLGAQALGQFEKRFGRAAQISREIARAAE